MQPAEVMVPRRSVFAASGLVSMLVLTGGPVAAQHATAPVATSLPADVSLPNTRRIEFVSRVNGHRYSINVALPFEPPPRHGYGVLYVIDGYSFFASATEVARDWNASNVVVVGIGYPTDSAFVNGVIARYGSPPAYYGKAPLWRIAPNMERQYDLTLPAGDRELAAQSLKGLRTPPSSGVGGLDQFLRTIETEVKPRVAALAPIDTTNQALFGHSLGGLATLRALLTEPRAFRSYIIASPSIWWNNRAVLADTAAFAATIRAGRATPMVLVAMGGDESKAVRYPKSFGFDTLEFDAYIRKARMVDNAADLVAWLKSLHGPPGYFVEDYALFEHEDHGAAPWSALARGVPFAFHDSQGP